MWLLSLARSFSASIFGAWGRLRFTTCDLCLVIAIGGLRYLVAMRCVRDWFGVIDAFFLFCFFWWDGWMDGPLCCGRWEVGLEDGGVEMALAERR